MSSTYMLWFLDCCSGGGGLLLANWGGGGLSGSFKCFCNAVPHTVFVSHFPDMRILPHIIVSCYDMFT